MSKQPCTALGYRLLSVCALAGLAFAASGCGKTAEAPAAAAAADAADTPLPPPAYESALPEGVREHLNEKFTGDLDQMIARRIIRVGVAANRTYYFVDKGTQRGAAYEMGMAFEDYLNKKLKTKPATKVNVVFLPLPRDTMGAALTEGRVDVVVAQVIVRPELQAIVDFSVPARSNVSEVIVSGPGAPAIATVDDLAGKEIYVRKESSAWVDLIELNGKLKAKGLAEVDVREVPGNLEDDDLLEMANAGIIPLTVAHDYLAAFWQKVFTESHGPRPIAVRSGGDARRAVPARTARKLAAEINAFLAKNGLGNGARQHDREALPGQHDVREVGDLRGRAQEVPGARRSSSRSTATSTRWTTC